MLDQRSVCSEPPPVGMLPPAGPHVPPAGGPREKGEVLSGELQGGWPLDWPGAG